MRIVFILTIILTIPAIGHSATIKVPGDYPSIQQAIDIAVNGDTVLVAPGTYVENIDFIGKAITVKSGNGSDVTYIDGNQSGSVVSFLNGEDQYSVLEGFLITNGYSGGYGGGIYCYQGSNPLIINNHINSNVALSGGGGISCQDSSPIISDNIIDNNSGGNGAGITILWGASNPNITRNTIINNIGDGIRCFATSNPNIYMNYIEGNIGDGICSRNYANPTIESNIILSNSIDGIVCGDEGDSIIKYNYISNNRRGIYIRMYSNSNIVENNIISYNSECGINCYGSKSLIKNNIIYCNGAGILVGKKSNVEINNCTIINNYSSLVNYGLYCTNGASVTIINTIFWNNSYPIGYEIIIEYHSIRPSTVTISYSDVKGGKLSVYVDPTCTLNWGAGMIKSDPLFAKGPNGFYYLCQVAAGQPADSPCVDSGNDLASNLGMNIYWTRNDCVPDSGIVDMGFHYGDFTFPSLQTDTFQIHESTGGDADFLLLAGLGNANRNYILLGSVTGTDPGIPLPGGQATLPINWDIFTNLVINLANTLPFSNFIGTLDSTGSANAIFNTLGPIPGAAGIKMNFAYALNGPWNFTSNPVGIEIVP